jgi:hypothetical protein
MNITRRLTALVFSALAFGATATSSILPVNAAPWESEPSFKAFSFGKTFNGIKVGSSAFRYGIVLENGKRYHYGELQLSVYTSCPGQVTATVKNLTRGMTFTGTSAFGPEKNQDGSWKVYMTKYKKIVSDPADQLSVQINEITANCGSGGELSTN